MKHVIFKFIQELKSQIISIVYAENSQTLDAVIITARNVEEELVMINESKQVYILEDQIV